MQSAAPIIVFGAVGFSLLMSIVFLLSKGSLYDQIGEGGLADEQERARRERAQGSPAGGPAAAGDELPFAGEGGLLAGPLGEQAEREQEIRQMVSARSERRVRRGEPALDVDAEVERLLAIEPAAGAERDQGIAEEVLQLVVARNERRERQGLEPLDIDAEVARTLAELDA
jgi:hypothetical protein